MEEYTILEQVKIRLKQFHIETVDNADGTQSDVVVFAQKEDNPLLEQLIKQVTNEVMNRRMYPSNYTQEQIDELNTINTYFAEYNKRVEACLKEEAEKEVELTFDKLSEEAFSKLVASNDWTCGQIMALSDAVAE